MSFWTDIARTSEPPRASDAIYVQLTGKDLFVVCEAGDATGAAAQLVPMALGSIVSAVAGATSNSATRILDAALENANRVLHDAKRFNPLVSDVVVSASIALRDAEGIHYASVGANSIFFRAGGSCRRLNEPENEARHLVSEGITSDPLPGSQEGASRPSVGLGLPPDVFRVRQSGSLREPEDYLLVLVGGRAACRLGTVHIETISPVGDEASTASRLLRQSGLRPEDSSAICAAHKAPELILTDDVAGHSRTAYGRPIREPLNIPWKALAGAGAILLLAIVAYLVFGPGNRSEHRSSPVLAPTTLLPTKPADHGGAQSQGVSPTPLDVALDPIDLTIPRRDEAEVLDSTYAPDLPDSASLSDAAPDASEPDGEVDREASEREEEQARERAERRRKRREERAQRRAEERARKEAEARAAARDARNSKPDVVTTDVIQYVDFTDPDVVAEAPDAGPQKRPFPSAKLENREALTDVVAESPSSASQEPDVVRQPRNASEVVSTPRTEAAEPDIRKGSAVDAGAIRVPSTDGGEVAL